MLKKKKNSSVHDFRAMVKLYQEEEVVEPDPGVALLDAAPPGRLVHLLHCRNGDVWHGSVGQSKGHADPLQTERSDSYFFFIFFNTLDYSGQMSSKRTWAIMKAYPRSVNADLDLLVDGWYLCAFPSLICVLLSLFLQSWERFKFHFNRSFFLPSQQRCRKAAPHPCRPQNRVLQPGCRR